MNSASCFQALVEQANNRMNTALNRAVVTNGPIAIAELLVEADPSDRHITNVNVDTLIYLAVKLGYNDIVKMICTTCRALSLDGLALHAAITKLPQESVLCLLRSCKRLVTYFDCSRGWALIEHVTYYVFDIILDVLIQEHNSYCTYNKCNFYDRIYNTRWILSKWRISLKSGTSFQKNSF